MAGENWGVEVDRGISSDIEVLTSHTHSEYFFFLRASSKTWTFALFSSFLKEILPLDILVKPGNNEEKKPHYK